MAVLDLLFPRKCLECRSFGKYICGNCLKKVRFVGWHDKNVLSIWKYEGVIRKAIIALKYKYATEIADELAGYASEILVSRCLVFSGCVLVPIPLHWYRQNFRGFNQAEIIGEKIAEKMDWKFIPDLLLRTKSTTPQVQLKGPARRQNLRGAFAVSPNILISQYPNIVLFDDVYTTGSTLLEALKVLKSGGITRVLCLTIAK